MTYRALRHSLIAMLFAGVAMAFDASALAAQTTQDAQTQGTTQAADDNDDGTDYGLAGLLGLLGLLGLRRRDRDHVHDVRVDPRATTSSTRP